ncbi:MAG: DUF6599 family protein [Candidatus Acidiferrales bacterium]
MRPVIGLLAAVLCLAVVPASAQGILPASFGGWSGSAKPGLAAPVFHNGDKTTQMLADQRAAARQEYGFVSGESGDYTRSGDSLGVNLYKMKDPSGAYGLYSYLRTTDMPRAEFTEHSSISHDRALVLIGNLVLEVQGNAVQRAEADLKALVATVSPHAQAGLLPTIGQHIPTKGFVDRTDKYVLGPETLNQVFPLASGDWLGFSQGAEVETAKYRVNGRELNLLIADFPTPQTAAKKLAELQKQFNVNGSSAGAGAGANSTPLFARRALTLLAIVSGANSQKEADALLGQIESGTEITWNEPTFEFKEPGIGVMIVGAITGTGIICMFALIAGLAFGGVRLVVKRATNKVFDRPDQVQVLQLGLSSKPINAEDFYGYRK